MAPLNLTLTLTLGMVCNCGQVHLRLGLRETEKLRYEITTGVDSNKCRRRPLACHHRLNGSSSHVLTATCFSYGSLCDFLTFFRNTPGGQTPQPIFTQNGSNDVDSRIDVPFAVKIEPFCNP